MGKLLKLTSALRTKKSFDFELKINELEKSSLTRVTEFSGPDQ